MRVGHQRRREDADGGLARRHALLVLDQAKRAAIAVASELTTGAPAAADSPRPPLPLPGSPLLLLNEGPSAPARVFEETMCGFSGQRSIRMRRRQPHLGQTHMRWFYSSSRQPRRGARHRPLPLRRVRGPWVRRWSPNAPVNRPLASHDARRRHRGGPQSTSSTVDYSSGRSGSLFHFKLMDGWTQIWATAFEQRPQRPSQFNPHGLHDQSLLIGSFVRPASAANVRMARTPAKPQLGVCT